MIDKWQFMGIDSRMLRKKRRQKLLDRIDKEKDEDIKRELRKGNIVRDIRFGVLNQKTDRS